MTGDYDYDCDGTPDDLDYDPATPADANLGDPGCETREIPDLSVGNPVNVATGNKYEEVLDIRVATPGIPLEFRRSYNNQFRYDGPFSSTGPLGYGWSHNYSLRLDIVKPTSPVRVRIWDSEGRALYFNEVQQTSSEILFGGESGAKDRLKQVISSGEYFLRRKKGNLTYKFEPDGKLLEISDPNGNTITLTYTGGLLTQVSNNFGKTISIGYNPQGRIETITDPNGKFVSYEYVNGDLTKVTYPDRPADRPDLFSSTTYSYLNHNLSNKKDSYDNLTGHWGYDIWKRVNNYYSHIKDEVHQEEIILTYPFGKTEVERSTGTTTYTTENINGIKVVKEVEGCSTCGGVHKLFDYDDRLNLISVTSVVDTDQITTEYDYDTPANPWEQIGEIEEIREAVGWPEARTTLYSYTHRTDDPFLLNDETETKPSVLAPGQNRVSTIIYNGQGKITSRQESGYTLINDTPTLKTYTTSYQYNSLGQLTQINGPRTDVFDITTLEYYDNVPGEGNNRGQLKGIVNVLGQRIEFSEYDANGNVGKIKDPNGVFTQYTYDERNRIKTVTNLATQASTQYFYDGRGNLAWVILPELNGIYFSYNLANKLTEIRDSLGNKIIFGYDQEGNRNREERKDPQGVLKKYLDLLYDPYNRLWKIINPDTTFTEYTYDENGNRKVAKDPSNNQTGYAYDKLNRLLTMTQTEAILGEILTSYEYDTHDNQKKVTDPNTNITQYTYDDFGKLCKTVSPDTGTTTYLYDEAGNLKQKTDARGTVVNYTYDALNRLTSVQFPSDPSQNITYTYDSLSVTYGIGRLTGMTDPSGSYTFHYAAQGNLSREEKNILGINYVTQYAYDKNNILLTITYPSGRTITYVPDGARRTSEVTTVLNGQPKTLASSIAYLPYGGITGLTYGNNLTLSQGYDNQYRISSIVAGSVLNRSYDEYFPNGNVKKITDVLESIWDLPSGPTKDYSYNPGTNKLTGIQGGTPVTFGYDSNGNITSANTRTYVYDLSNQLTQVIENSIQIAEYIHNGFGQRIKKSSQAGIRIFHYDSWGHLIAETNQSGQMLAEYIYLGDQLLAMIKPGESAYYFHNDHLGTPQLLTDGNGNVAWKAVYTPFGQAVVSIETVENPFRFPGQYHDQETGLNYNYFRYYNPPIGRYITPDPIGLVAGINLFAYVDSVGKPRFEANLYTYARNNPLYFIDPSGLASHSWKYWAGGIIGLAGIAVAGVTGVSGVGLVAGGIMVGVGAALIIWDAFEDYETIDKADKKYVDPLRKELEENEKALKELEKENNTKSNNCKEKGK